MQDAVLRDYQEQIARLKAQLEEAQSGKPASSMPASQGVQSIEEIVEQEVRRRLQEQVSNLSDLLPVPLSAVLLIEHMAPQPWNMKGALSGSSSPQPLHVLCICA